MSPVAHANLPELLYIQDPLCAWSYGLSPVINRIQQEYAGRVDVSVLCGGMATGDDVEPLAAVWPDLRDQLAEVARVTGVAAGPALSELAARDAYLYDSEPPCRAITTFRQITQDPARAVAFAHEVQMAFFRDGHDLSDPTTYNALLAPFDIEVVDFHQRFALPETAKATQQEFAAVRRIGVQGFPTVVLRVGEQGYVLARGYQPFEQLRAGLEQLIAVSL